MSMSVNLLAINVGNTRAQLGAFVDGKLVDLQRVSYDSTQELNESLEKTLECLRDSQAAAIYLASVNEPASQRISQIVAAATDLPVARMERDVPIPIGRQLDVESIVGEDRLLNAAAAFDRIQSACIIVDAGTAVTVDFVDGKGTFHGGAILSGAQMMLDALHEHTDMLPAIKFTKPDEAIGHSTAQAMLGGVFHGVRGAVRELVEKYAEFYQGYPKVIATGGDAQMLFDGYDLIEAIVPELTLLGMVVAHRYVLNPPE